jgi:hypothetical protein
VCWGNDRRHSFRAFKSDLHDPNGVRPTRQLALATAIKDIICIAKLLKPGTAGEEALDSSRTRLAAE